MAGLVAVPFSSGHFNIRALIDAKFVTAWNSMMSRLSISMAIRCWLIAFITSKIEITAGFNCDFVTLYVRSRSKTWHAWQFVMRCQITFFGRSYTNLKSGGTALYDKQLSVVRRGVPPCRSEAMLDTNRVCRIGRPFGLPCLLSQ